MTQEEIKKLARQYLDSLTDRERFLDTLLVENHGKDDPDLIKGFEKEAFSLTEKMNKVIEKIEGRMRDEEVEEFENSLSREINEILRKEPIIDIKPETVETKRGLEGSSQKRLS